MASLSVPVRTVVPSIHPSSSTAVARARLGLHYGCCHYFRQPPFRLLVHAHAGHPRTLHLLESRFFGGAGRSPRRERGTPGTPRNPPRQAAARLLHFVPALRVTRRAPRRRGWRRPEGYFRSSLTGFPTAWPRRRGDWPAHARAACGSNSVPSRSMAQATLRRRSATERRERAWPWPRRRSASYRARQPGSCCTATRAQW